MKRPSVGPGVKLFALVCGLSALYFLYPETPFTPRQRLVDRPEPRFEEDLPPRPPPADLRTWGAPDMGPEPVRYEWQERLVLAQAYDSFVAEALPAANSGDADAQFALHLAFVTCHHAKNERDPQHRARMAAQCEGLAREYGDLGGESKRWFELSRQANFPRALAHAALRDLHRVNKAEMSREERARAIAQVKSRLVEALAANDPGITGLVAMEMPGLFPAEPRGETAHWVWRLASCEQGMECGSGALWIAGLCGARGDCREGETGAEYIRRASGDLPSLQARARQLARKLRHGELTLEDFDDSVFSLPEPRRGTPYRPAAKLGR